MSKLYYATLTFAHVMTSGGFQVFLAVAFVAGFAIQVFKEFCDRR